MALVLSAPETPAFRNLDFGHLEHELRSSSRSSFPLEDYVMLVYLAATKEHRSDRPDAGALLACSDVPVNRSGNSATASDEHHGNPDDHDNHGGHDDNGCGNLQASCVACPYEKHDTEVRQTVPRCSGAGFSTFAALKIHMRRTHNVLICRRCATPYTSHADMRRHMAEDILCHEDATSQTSLADKWRRLYAALFPGDPIPSPCELNSQTPSLSPL